MKIIVFGASGFVGGWICELLNGRSDVEVIACLRRWAAAARVARRGIQMIQVDLDSAADLSEVVRGADAVINAAVPASDQEPELALRLYMACIDAGVRRFVQFSSAALYGDLTGDVNEDARPAPIDEYGRGKAEMEARLRNAAASAVTQLFILRPSIIYGPFSDAWTVRYAHRIANGRWRGLGWLGEGTCNLIYAGDVARAAVLCAVGNVAPGSLVLNINGPEIVSWNTYFEKFGDALGVQNRANPASAKILLMMAGTEAVRTGGKWLLTHFEQYVRRFTLSGKTGPSVMAGAKSLAQLYPALNEVGLLRRKVKYTWDRAASEIDFRPQVSLYDGLQWSARWCHVHGVV